MQAATAEYTVQYTFRLTRFTANTEISSSKIRTAALILYSALRIESAFETPLMQ